jgi:hypothetical protein
MDDEVFARRLNLRREASNDDTEYGIPAAVRDIPAGSFN